MSLMMQDIQFQILTGNSALSSADLKQAQLISNRVIVRIWVSAGNSHAVTGENVGHISIETPNKYISLWPQSIAKEREGLGILKPIKHEFLLNYQKDLDHEGRLPEFVYCFYQLDHFNMDLEFEKLKSSLKGWGLLGDILCADSQSCASAAYHILRIGGISRYRESSFQQESAFKSESSVAFWSKKAHASKSSFYLSVSNSKQAKLELVKGINSGFYSIEISLNEIFDSPDKLAIILDEAKKQEIVQNPTSKDILFPRYDVHLLTFERNQIATLEAYFKLYPPQYNVILLIKCENNTFVWTNHWDPNERRLVEINIDNHQDLAAKFPLENLNICTVLKDAFANQLISLDAYNEITAKGGYLFTEKHLPEEQGGYCLVQ